MRERWRWPPRISPSVPGHDPYNRGTSRSTELLFHMRCLVERRTRLSWLQRVWWLFPSAAVPTLRRTLPHLVETRPYHVPRQWQSKMDRRMWTELWSLPRGTPGACIGKITSHLVNGVQRRMYYRKTSLWCTVNHAQDLIHHHPYSVTPTPPPLPPPPPPPWASRKTCECGFWMHKWYIMFLRSKDGRTRHLTMKENRSSLR